MGYRNETDALRARVDQLEEELAVLKGRKLAERGERDWGGKVKRQTILIVLVAVIGTLGAGSCLVPMTIGLLAAAGDEVTADEIASASWDGTYSRRVQLRAALDATDVLREDWSVAPEARYAYGPEGYLIPVAGRSNVVLYCATEQYGASDGPCALAGDARLAAEGDEPARQRLARAHEISGTVYDVDADGYGFWALEHADLVSYASERGFAVDELRIVSVDRPRTAEIMPLIVMGAMFGAFALFLWIAVLMHRVLARRTVELPTAADMMNRDPMMTIVFSILTCGLYELYWQYVTTLQLRRLTGRPDLQPGVDLLLTIGTMRLWSYWVAYRNAEAVDEAMSDMGELTTHRNTALLMAVGTWMCGIFHWVMVFKLQEAMNALFLEKMSHEEDLDADPPQNT